MNGDLVTMARNRTWQAFAALVVIGVSIAWSHAGLVAHGMCFNDPSWYFHFGRRLLAGDIPYRDYIFQVGPLPIFTDALAQRIFGSRYVASLYAAIATKILRVFVVWLIGRRIGDVRTATLLAVFCCFDPIFAFAHHWSTPYAQLFLTASGYFLLCASQAAERAALVEIALGGLFAGLVVSARQSSAAVIGVVLVGVPAVMRWREEFFTTRRLGALWVGLAGGLALAFLPLAFVGALRPGIQQMFLDAPAKKAVHGVDALLDAVSGGSLVLYQYDPSTTWWGGFLTWIGLPLLASLAVLYVLSRKNAAGAISAAIPAALILAMLTRFANLSVFSDLPRTMLTVILLVALFAPARCRAWFGVEPIVVVALGLLPLASDWAMEMSYPGRGWGDPPSLTVGLLLLVLASSRLDAPKRWLCSAALAGMGLVYLVSCLRAGVNPFAKDDSSDGTLAENHVEMPDPILRGLKINESRAKTIAWLESNVPRGSTCFVYGNLPVLYSVLGCVNPTVVDTTAADFITAADADAAIRTLQSHPPDFILAHEKSWMNPPLTLDLEDKIERYDGMNPKASRAMHVGLRSILDQYESVGLVADILGPALAKQASVQRDIIDATRLYRRRSSPVKGP